MSSVAIETLNLTKEFTQCRSKFLMGDKKAILALDNVNIQVKEGELFGLLGPNGAGKTTLLKLLSGLILPTSGKAFIMGYDTVTQEDKIKTFIGVIADGERSFYWRLTGRENLTFFGSLYNLTSQQIKTTISQLAELLGIESMLDRRFMEYSTGIKHKFSIARALLHNPSILLIDEPTKSLDPNAANTIRKFIKEQLAGEQDKTVLLTTHQIAEAESMCSRIAILDKGRIKACDTVDNLKKSGITLETLFTKVTE